MTGKINIYASHKIQLLMYHISTAYRGLCFFDVPRASVTGFWWPTVDLRRQFQSGAPIPGSSGQLKKQIEYSIDI